jgi:hypothetical protein
MSRFNASALSGEEPQQEADGVAWHPHDPSAAFAYLSLTIPRIMLENGSLMGLVLYVSLWALEKSDPYVEGVKDIIHHPF